MISIRKIFDPYLKEPCDSLLRWDQAILAVQAIIRTFYFFNFFICIWHLSSYKALYSTRGLDLLWPVTWLQGVNIEHGITAILLVYLVSSLAAVACPGSFAIRVAVFISLLEVVALKNSFGKIGHSTHFLVLLSFLLCFLPHGWQIKKGQSKLVRHKTFLIFWGCQLMMMLTYTMSGVGKISCGVYQMFRGEMGAFHPLALGVHIAERLQQTNSQSLLENFFIHYPLLGWPLMYGAIYLQFFSIWMVFRPHIQRVWALGIICFHLSVFLTMGINFPINVFLVALFFMASPFLPTIFSWRKVLSSLPILGGLYQQIWERPQLDLHLLKRADKKLRILVLTSSTGGGHDMRAAALKAWAQKESDLHIEVTIHQALEQTHAIYRFGVAFYNWIQKHWPALHHLYFNYLEIFPHFRKSHALLGAHRFCKVLQRVQPNVIVSVHGSLNHAFFDIARSFLGEHRVCCVTYCGELSGGYGFSRNWVNPRADLFIPAVAELQEAALSHGMPKERIWVGGFLLMPSFWSTPLDAAARKRFIIEELGLDPERFILVLGTGAVGANNHLALLNALDQRKVYPQVVVLCSKRLRVLWRVEAWARAHPQMRLKALPYTRQMAQLLQCASAFVTRPGTGSTSEAILARCPIIFNGIAGIMPQERITVRFCKKHEIAESITRAHQLPALVERWMRNSEELEAIRLKMKAAAPQQTPRQILEKLRGIAPS